MAIDNPISILIKSGWKLFDTGLRNDGVKLYHLVSDDEIRCRIIVTIEDE